MDQDDFSRFFKDVDFTNLFRDLRNAAWLKTGAAMFGGSVAEYRRALVEGGLDPVDATTMTVVTIQEVVRGISGAAVGMMEAAVRLADVFERMQEKHGGKEVPE